MPLDVFLMAMSFVVKVCSYFIYDGGIYQQVKSLIMGCQISQILAEIVTNCALIKTASTIGDEHLSFLFKYVDDIAFGMEEGVMERFQATLCPESGRLRIKHKGENSENEINYLNLSIKRMCDRTLITSWWHKPCSSRQIINFHSFYLKSVKDNVIREHVSFALYITSPENKIFVKKSLRDIISRSSYPTYYSETMSLHDRNNFNFLERLRLCIYNIYNNRSPNFSSCHFTYFERLF